MKSFTAAAIAAATFGVVSAKRCTNITVPVTINARNARFDQQALTPHSNIDATNFILNLSRQGHNYTQETIQGYANVAGTYQLATTYCEPDNGAPNTVQLLTHGIGFDRSYWNVPYNNYNYSYSNVAVDQYGFATFSWDRLGIGMSQHGEPVNEIQTALEVQALRALTLGLRNGSIQGVPRFERVLHLGHSFGSVQTYALTAAYPELSDGIALTGFSQNGSFLPFFELGGDFTQANLNSAFAQYPDGYLAPASASAVQTNFFAPGDFDPQILPFSVATGEPVTIGELLTIGSATNAPNPLHAPVLIITGERDVPFCGGDCLAAPTGYSSIPETSRSMFANAAPFEVSIVAGAGHGLNLQYTHVRTYNTINQFFNQNGVGSGANGSQPGASAPASSGSVSYPGPTGQPYGGRPNGWGQGGYGHGHGWQA